MGQNQGSTNPLIADWKRHPEDPNCFIHIPTGDLAECFTSYIRKFQQPIFRKRLQENYNYVAKILYYEAAQKNKVGKQQAKFHIYAQKLYKFSQDLWTPITSALSILKGFRRLSGSYGFTSVNLNMIKVNNKREVRVWINQSPIKNQAFLKVDSEQEMLNDIIKIISVFDIQMGSFLHGSKTMNEAINKTLQSIAKNQICYNQTKILKNEDTRFFLINQKFEETNNNKDTNKFRSTNETQNNQIRPIKGKVFKQINPNGQECQNYNPYFTKQNRSNINFNNISDQTRTMYSSGQRKVLTRDAQQISPKNRVNYSQQTKAINSNNYIHGQQHRDPEKINYSKSSKYLDKPPIYIPSQYRAPEIPFSAQQSPVYSKSHHLLPKDKTTLKKIYEVNYMGQKNKIEKKSNLIIKSNKQLMPSYDSKSVVKTVYMNEKSEVHTSRELIQDQVSNEKLAKNYIQHVQNIDQTRTKTQFYNYNVSNVSRFKTNYLESAIPYHVTSHTAIQNQNLGSSNNNSHSNSGSIKNIYSMNEGKKINTNSIIQKEQRRKQTEKQIRVQQDEQIGENTSEQQRRLRNKQKQAQKIKQQMNFLGIGQKAKAVSTQSILLNQKSSKDLLIKKKVEQKNRKHQDLKLAINKLLKQ